MEHFYQVIKPLCDRLIVFLWQLSVAGRQPGTMCLTCHMAWHRPVMCPVTQVTQFSQNTAIVCKHECKILIFKAFQRSTLMKMIQRTEVNENTIRVQSGWDNTEFQSVSVFVFPFAIHSLTGSYCVQCRVLLYWERYLLSILGKHCQTLTILPQQTNKYKLVESN